MAKTRSPNYPAMSLPEAIEKVTMIYHKDFLNEMPSEVAAQHMGYSGINGASLTALSALKKYGLLEGRGDATKVTSTAQSIIEAMPGADEAIDQAASRPALWDQITSHFGFEIPSENNLRAFLLKRRFNPGKVGSVIKNYIDTLEYVRTHHSGYNTASPKPTVSASGEEGHPMQVHRNTGILASASPESQVMVLPMGRDFVATISFSGEITQKRLNKLISYVELAKEEYPEDVNRDPEEPSNS